MSIDEFNRAGFTGGTRVEFLNLKFEVISVDFAEQTITIDIDGYAIEAPIALCEMVED